MPQIRLRHVALYKSDLIDCPCQIPWLFTLPSNSVNTYCIALGLNVVNVAKMSHYRAFLTSVWAVLVHGQFWHRPLACVCCVGYNAGPTGAEYMDLRSVCQYKSHFIIGFTTVISSQWIVTCDDELRKFHDNDISALLITDTVFYSRLQSSCVSSSLTWHWVTIFP